MSKKSINEKINNEFDNTPVETTVKTYMLDMLKNFSLENLECLEVADNTMNGDDTEKNSWRAHFTNFITEEDFYIEVSITPSGTYKCRCFTIEGEDANNILEFDK